jgi:hypothetical protein
MSRAGNPKEQPTDINFDRGRCIQNSLETFQAYSFPMGKDSNFEHRYLPGELIKDPNGYAIPRLSTIQEAVVSALSYLSETHLQNGPLSDEFLEQFSQSAQISRRKVPWNLLQHAMQVGTISHTDRILRRTKDQRRLNLVQDLEVKDAAELLTEREVGSFKHEIGLDDTASYLPKLPREGWEIYPGKDEGFYLFTKDPKIEGRLKVVDLDKLAVLSGETFRSHIRDYHLFSNLSQIVDSITHKLRIHSITEPDKIVPSFYKDFSITPEEQKIQVEEAVKVFNSMKGISPEINQQLWKFTQNRRELLVTFDDTRSTSTSMYLDHLATCPGTLVEDQAESQRLDLIYKKIKELSSNDTSYAENREVSPEGLMRNPNNFTELYIEATRKHQTEAIERNNLFIKIIEETRELKSVDEFREYLKTHNPDLDEQLTSFSNWMGIRERDSKPYFDDMISRLGSGLTYNTIKVEGVSQPLTLVELKKKVDQYFDSTHFGIWGKKDEFPGAIKNSSGSHISDSNLSEVLVLIGLKAWQENTMSRSYSYGTSDIDTINSTYDRVVNNYEQYIQVHQEELSMLDKSEQVREQVLEEVNISSQEFKDLAALVTKNTDLLDGTYPILNRYAFQVLFNLLRLHRTYVADFNNKGWQKLLPEMFSAVPQEMWPKFIERLTSAA